MADRYFKVVKSEGCSDLDRYIGRTLKLLRFRGGEDDGVVELFLDDKSDWYAWYADSVEEVFQDSTVEVALAKTKTEVVSPAPTKAPEFLDKASALMRQRGEQYDKPEGERSMGVCVQAFNTITGKNLTESEGWLLLQLLKDVRQWQNPDKYHADSAEDCIAYAALKAEALAQGA